MRKLMWFTIGFGAACALGTYLRFRFWVGVLLILAVCMVFGLWFFKGSITGRRIGAAGLGLLIGTAYFLGFDGLYTAPVRAMDGDTVALQIQIYSYSWDTDYGSAVDGHVQIEGISYRIRLYLNEKTLLKPGDVYWGPVKLRLTTDGGENEPTFHRSNGIMLLGYQRGEAEYSYLDTTDHTYFAAELRERLKEIIDGAFPEDAAGFARALLLGDRTGIGYEMSSDFSVSGISHIVAVSGLHMSILFAFLYLVTFKRRYLLAVLGIPGVLLFMAVAAFTPSVTRAGLMQILIILALCLNREYDPPTALAFSALVMLAVNPLVISSVGFQLSVASVAGIFLFSESIRKWLLDRIPDRIPRRLRRWFASGVSVSLAAQIMTTPLIAIYYGTVSLIGVVTNLAVLWVITFVFYGVMAVCLVGLVCMPAAGAAAWVVAWPIRYVIGTAGLFASVPLAAVYTKSVYIVIWLVLCYCLLILSRGRRPLISLCIAGLGLCAALGVSWAEPMVFDHCVTAVNVGQGQCIILQHRGKTFVVDCGGDYAADAADCAAEKLLSMGIQRIDGLILTHYDLDHVGGAAYLLYRIGADALYLPETAGEEAAGILKAGREAEVIWVENDLLLESDGMKITLFAPENAANDNESSVAVLFQTEKCDTLITGDMSAAAEQKLLLRSDIPQLEVLVVGHHGSRSSTSLELLQATTPEVAMISVGKDNRYNHPTEQVLDLLTLAGCDIYRTDESGDITFRR